MMVWYVFHDPTGADPDWRVKVWYLIMIASASKTLNGIKLLETRNSRGRQQYPDFGK
jgi:hypothetical protein